MTKRARYPRVLPEVEVVPVEGRAGETCYVTPIGIEVALDASMSWIARSFDGRRTCDAIAAALRADGVQLHDDDLVHAVADHLADVGCLVYLDAPIEVESAEPNHGDDGEARTLPSGLRHRCTGCGRSCQGHFLGPLDPDFLARAEDLHTQLQAIYPELEAVPMPYRTVMRRGKPIQGLFTRDSDAGCIYLGEDRRCRIHAHFGPEQKPLICRLFPAVRVLTESGVRLGVEPRCYMQRESIDDSPAPSMSAMTGVSPEWLPTPLMRHLGANASTFEGPFPLGSRARVLDAERALLELLQRPDWTPMRLLAVVADFRFARPITASSATGGDLGAVGAALRPRLERMGADLRLESGHRPRPTTGGDSHLDEVYRLAQALGDLSPDPPALTDAERRYAALIIGSWLHLRNWADMPAFDVGVTTVILGAFVAAWCDPDPDAHQDQLHAFTFTLTAWMRVVRRHSNVAALFDGDADLELLFAQLGLDQKV